MLVNAILPTLKSYVYARLLPILKSSPPVHVNIPIGKEGQLPIAAICDPMTWQNLCHEHASVSLMPRTWREVLEINPGQKVKFLFCEATWSGIINGCWRGQVYRDGRVFYENRRDLLEILERCKSEGIPTVFWAKEDPVYFQDAVYDFTDTALKFDYILTTAEECIPKYYAMGHQHVYLWPFGFSPGIYYPSEETQVGLRSSREDVAIFAGSWYIDHPRRCRDLLEIFEVVLDAGIPLRIYDRHRISGRSTRPFPEKYQPYVRDSVPYEALGDIYRNTEYTINVNTVCDSGTMFSRRVYEAMACGCIIISNESLGMRRQFGNNLWYVGESNEFSRFDPEHKEYIRQRNIDIVFSSHTWNQRMEQLCALVEGNDELIKNVWRVKHEV